ncbi:MAG: hypothetical protein V3V78_00485 [Candidatus Woesearchaeota archaeon]
METNQQNQEQNKPIDDDSTTDLVNRDIIINDDGSALVKETQMTTVKMGARDFISWMRKHEETRENIKKTLSDEVRKATEVELKKVEDDIENLKPYIEDSEKKAKAHYEKLKKEGLISHVSEEFKKPMSEINLDYMNQVWHNLMENEKEVLDTLTAEQKQKFLKIKLKIIQKNRGKKQ